MQASQLHYLNKVTVPFVNELSSSLNLNPEAHPEDKLWRYSTSTSRNIEIIVTS